MRSKLDGIDGGDPRPRCVLTIVQFSASRTCDVRQVALEQIASNILSVKRSHTCHGPFEVSSSTVCLANHVNNGNRTLARAPITQWNMLRLEEFSVSRSSCSGFTRSSPNSGPRGAPL